MLTKSRNLLVATAGAVAVAVAQASITILQSRLSLGLLIPVVVALCFTTYVASFGLFDRLYVKFLWPRFNRRNLSGIWTMHLSNLTDGSTRTGTVTIVHTPDELRVSCVNYRDGHATPYSTWASVFAAFTSDATLMLLYEVESTSDWKPFKRGVMRLMVVGDRPDLITGDFFDNAPSDDRGPVELTRSVVRKG